MKSKLSNFSSVCPFGASAPGSGHKRCPHSAQQAPNLCISFPWVGVALPRVTLGDVALPRRYSPSASAAMRCHSADFSKERCGSAALCLAHLSVGESICLLLPTQEPALETEQAARCLCSTESGRSWLPLLSDFLYCVQVCGCISHGTSLMVRCDSKQRASTSHPHFSVRSFYHPFPPHICIINSYC